jgi:hypothetical protein
MSSQFQHHFQPLFKSAAPELQSGLRRRSPEAERQALIEFNATQPPERRIEVPEPGAEYGDYATGHLALLWRHVRNGEALTILARRHRARLRLPTEP